MNMERKKRMDRISMTRICKYSNICERLCKYLKTIFTVKTEHTITHKYIQSLCKRQQHKMRWANVDMLRVVEDKKKETHQNWRLPANWVFATQETSRRQLRNTRRKLKSLTSIEKNTAYEEEMNFLFCYIFFFAW